MRYLFTVHNFLPEPLFGSEKVCVCQMARLLKLGHDVALFYAGNKIPSEDQLVQHGLEGLRLFPSPLLRIGAHVILSVWRPMVALRFKDAIREFAPDTVVFHHLLKLSLNLPSVAKRMGVRSICYLHDFYFVCGSFSLFDSHERICSGGSPYKCCKCLYEARFGCGVSRIPVFLAGLPFIILRNQLIKTVCRDVDVFVSPSKFLPQELAKIGFETGKCVVIPYGADKSERTGPRSSDDPIRLGFIGNPVVKKGIDLLVKALKGPLSRSLLMYGFGNQNSIEEFRRSTKDFHADLRVYCSDLGSFYKSVDAVIVPSVWYENQPRVIIEAFTAGKAVICSDLGGMGEMIREYGGGLLFKPGDPEDLRRKIESLIENPELLNTLVATCRSWPTVEEEVDRLHALALGIVQGREITR